MTREVAEVEQRQRQPDRELERDRDDRRDRRVPDRGAERRVLERDLVVLRPDPARGPAHQVGERPLLERHEDVEDDRVDDERREEADRRQHEQVRPERPREPARPRAAAGLAAA
jgi:hypothetical protein